MKRQITAPDSIFLALILCWISATTMWDLAAPLRRPVAFHSYQVKEPVEAGDKVFVTMDVTIRRRCGGTIVWFLVSETGEAYAPEFRNVGRTAPGEYKGITFPVLTVPKDAPQGKYLLVGNRTDYCPGERFDYPTMTMEMIVL